MELFACDTLLRQREIGRQLFDHMPIARMVLPVIIFITEVIILISPHQHDAARFLVSEKGDGVVGALLQITEAHDVTEHLDGVENAVRAGIGLDQTVHFQVLVHPQCVQRRRIEAGQKHIHYNQQIKLLVLHPQRNILVVILELIPVRRVVGAEHLVVVTDGRIQEITGIPIKCRGVLRVLLVEDSVRFFLVCAIAVNDRYLKPALRMLCHLTLKLGIIQLGSIDTGHGKNGIKPADTLLLFDLIDLLPAACGSHFANVFQHTEGVGLIATICFLVKVRQDIIRNNPDALGSKKRFFPVDVPDFLVVNIRLGLHRLDVIHSEGQHVFVVDSIYNRVGVKLVAERLLRCADGALAHARIDCKDGRAGKAEQIVLLKILGDSLMHIAELAAVAFVKNDDYPLVKHRMSGVLFDESRQLLNGGDNDFGVVIFQLTLQDRR